MRPTGTGLAVALAAVVLALVGVRLGYPELVGLAAAAVVLLVLAVVAVWRHPPLDVTVPASARVERGTAASVALLMRLRRRRPLGGLRLRDLGGGDVMGLPALSRSEAVEVALPVPTSRRGRVVLGPWRLERVDAWGLAVRRLAVIDAVEVLVLPRLHPVSVAHLPMAEAESRGAQEAGTTHVATLREYVVGDELRQVHWRSSAKTGHLMVRQYVDSRRPGVDVVLDVSPDSYGAGPAGEDAFDAAVDAAASLAVAVAATGVPTTVRTTAGATARAGQGRHAGVLDLLAEVATEDAAAPARRRTRASLDEPASLVHVTGPDGVLPPAQPGVRRVVVRVGRAQLAGARTPGTVLVASAAELVELPATSGGGWGTRR